MLKQEEQMGWPGLGRAMMTSDGFLTGILKNPITVRLGKRLTLKGRKECGHRS